MRSKSPIRTSSAGSSTRILRSATVVDDGSSVGLFLGKAQPTTTTSSTTTTTSSTTTTTVASPRPSARGSSQRSVAGLVRRTAAQPAMARQDRSLPDPRLRDHAPADPGVAVVPFYEQFIARFPTVDSLASAVLQDVLDAWTGLGYNTRALRLRTTCSNHPRQRMADDTGDPLRPARCRSVHRGGGCFVRLRGKRSGRRHKPQASAEPLARRGAPRRGARRSRRQKCSGSRPVSGTRR